MDGMNKNGTMVASCSVVYGGYVDGWITRKDKNKPSNLLEDVGYCMSDLT
jgi:hypothetical protein